MRTAFIDALVQQAQRNPRVWLVNGDLGYSVVERFATQFPERYLNAGVSEQNMTGVAAGLAMAGNIVFTYSIANFPTFRCLEQIRNDVCYHNLSVVVVAVGGGLSYGSLGYSHHGVEDFAVMGCLPNMLVVAPGDPIETRLAVRELVNRAGPAYLRLGKAGEPQVHANEPPFTLGKATMVRNGDRATVIATGGMLKTAVDAALVLEKQGINIRVLSMHTVEPIDDAAVIDAIDETGRIITIEEHGGGGLASRVSEIIARTGKPVPFTPIRLSRTPSSLAGSQKFLREKQGLSVEGILACFAK